MCFSSFTSHFYIRFVLLFTHRHKRPHTIFTFLTLPAQISFFFFCFANECGKLWKIGSNIIFFTPCHGIAENGYEKKKYWVERLRRNVRVWGIRELKKVWEWNNNTQKGACGVRGWIFSRSYIFLYAETEAPEQYSVAVREKRILFVGECYYSHYSISLLLFMSKALYRVGGSINGLRKIVGSKLFTELCSLGNCGVRHRRCLLLYIFYFAFFLSLCFPFHNLPPPPPSHHPLVRALWVELNQHTEQKKIVGMRYMIKYSKFTAV